MEERFAHTYSAHAWGGSSPSGPGSSIHYTESLRTLLPTILRALKCRTLLDAPCGDLNWISNTNLDGITYIGGDIVKILIDDLRSKHPSWNLCVLDVTQQKLPDADFWLCRDIIFHLSNADIYRVLFNFIKSEIKYFATTHHPQCGLTEDCLSDPDSWRLVNLTGAPFHLPQPLHTIWDAVDGFPPRWLAIWARDQILNWLNHINAVAASAASFSPR